MKISKLQERLQADRPMSMVSLRIPENVIEDLKRIATLLESLRRQGVEHEIIATAVAEAQSPAQAA